MSGATFDPMSRSGFDAIAYNAVGRASEVNNFPAYALSHSTGNSGWSVGFMQWDFGQGGRGEAAADLVSRYQASATQADRFSDEEAASLTERLQIRGQTGNDLSAIEQRRLNAFLRSDEGRAFVQTLDVQQLNRKWGSVGEPLSQIEWLQERSGTEPRDAVEIVAMASKLFNQNEVRGGRLLDRLSQGPMTSEDVRDWIGSDGVHGLTTASSNAILSGRDKALSGAQLLGDAAFGRGGISDMFRDEAVSRSNPSLSAGYGDRVGVQLLDAAFRDPERGRQLLGQIERGEQTFRPVAFGGTSEVAKVALSASGELYIGRAGYDPIALDAKSLSPAPAPNRLGFDETTPPAVRGSQLTTTPLGMPGDVAEQAGAIQHHLISAPSLSKAPDLRDPTHPGHAAFNEMVHRVGNFERANGIPSGPHTDQLAAALLRKVIENKVSHQNVYLERDSATGRVDLVDRRNVNLSAEESPRIPLDLARLSSQSIELSSHGVNGALSKHYSEPLNVRVQTRTTERAQILASLSFDDQVMFGRIRREVPGHIGDGHVLQAMAEAKRNDLAAAAGVGGVMMLGDSIRVMGKGEGAPVAQVDVTQPAPRPEASLHAIHAQNQQQELALEAPAHQPQSARVM